MATCAAERNPGNPQMIGILGGTFDPVHHGHLRIAIDAMESLHLDEVRLIPLAQAVHRRPPRASTSLRWDMLQAATHGRRGLVADDRELRRAGPSYTVDTLAELAQSHPGQGLCLLLGTDAFNGFRRWHKPEKILGLAHIGVLRRPDVDIAAEMAALYLERRVERLDPHGRGQIVDCDVAQLQISSSDIRARLQSGRRVDFLVPDAVAEIIASHDLYRDPAGAH
jgi:nicotinate-nucleotide adenylyltransferase